ncbi:hypothetical protein ACFOW9_09920, partial [Arthrobacter cryoconiti]
MRVIIRRSLCAAVFAGGLLALGAGAASAAEQPDAGATSAVSTLTQNSTSTQAPTGGLLGGILDHALGDVLGTVQVAVPVTVPVTVPVNVSGNAVGVLGNAISSGS